MKFKSFLKSHSVWIIIGFVILFIILFLINFNIRLKNLKNKKNEIKELNQQYVRNIKNLKKKYASKLKILKNKNKALAHKLYSHNSISTDITSAPKLTLPNNSKESEMKSNKNDKTLSQTDFYNALLSTDTEIKEKGEIMDSNPLNDPPPPPSPSLHL
ncbi:MAG TPA: hypothetical protein QF753_03410 [Victivallales bacterium]|nr:hypothetical protein [Victivallales bacterium]